MESIKLSYFVLSASFLMGGLLSIFYLTLLWYSVRILPKIKKRGLFLFLSVFLRLVLFLVLAIYLSQNNVGKFLGIVTGFIITRLIVVSLVKNERKSLHD